MRPSLQRVALVAAICVFVLTSVTVAVTAAGPLMPKQFYRPLGQAMDAAPRPIMAVAHNAGNDVATARRAVQQGADVIEIDVLLWDGRLRAAHHRPASPISHAAWAVRPPQTLADAWQAARTAPAIQLDIKDASPELVPLLIAFISARQGETRVIVSGPDLAALDQIGAALPEVQRVLSIGNRCVLASVRSDSAPLSTLAGVSARANVLDADDVAWFQEHGLFVLAWTIDDFPGLQRVLDLNVDAVSTNNLAIVEYLQRTGDEPAHAGARQPTSRLLPH